MDMHDGSGRAIAYKVLSDSKLIGAFLSPFTIYLGSVILFKY